MASSVTAWRHELHRHPELSGQEKSTAQRVLGYLHQLGVSTVKTGIGGEGILAEITSGKAGPTLLFRCELDALPIQETNTFAYASCQHGVGHQCGHDGHMAILLETARRLVVSPPVSGKVLLLFQPAEETGAGAAMVRTDPVFAAESIDHVYALHNMPGEALGSVIIKAGTMNCASRGMTIRWHGKAAHAAQPETGHSPALAMSGMIKALSTFGKCFGQHSLAMATVVGARLGDKAFGTAPSEAECFVTLRSESNEVMQAMLDAIDQLLQQQRLDYHLQTSVAFEDVFPAVVNTVAGVEVVKQAAAEVSAICRTISKPIRWSEDVGLLIDGHEGALFGLGAGENQPELHHPDYDFPDELINHGADIFYAVMRQCTGNTTGRVQ